ncbi:MAG: ferredoxin [Lachnospiraceae bacterium]|nr:ferredoxin [Lachnospiraceae bacterium]
MTAYVNENCIGCGMCASICPEVFQMTDENVALADDVLPELEDATKEAAQSCPVNAIEIGKIGLE